MAAETIQLVLNVDTSGARTQVKGFSDDVRKLWEESERVKPSLGNTSKAAGDLGKKATEAKGAVAGIAAGLSLISPQAATAVQALGNVSGAIGGIGKAATLLGASAGPLALLAAAVAAIGVAWKIVADNAKEAEEKQKKAAATATLMQNSTNQIEASRAVDKFQAGKSTRSDAIAELAAAGAQTPEAKAAHEQTVLAQATFDKAQSSATDAAGDQATTAAAAALRQAKKNEQQAVLKYATTTIDAAAAEVKKDAPAAGAATATAVRAKLQSIDWAPNAPGDIQVEQDINSVQGNTIQAGSTGGGGTDDFSSQLNDEALTTEAKLHDERMGNVQAEIGLVMQMASAVSSIANDLANAFGANDEVDKDGNPKKHPNSLKNWLKGIWGGVQIAAGAALTATGVGAGAGVGLIVSGAGTEASLASDIHNQKQNSYDVGSARITHNQLAWVHKDEEILTPGAAAARRQGMSSESTAPVVNHIYQINGPVGDAAFRQIILDEMSKALGPGGNGYSTGLTGGLRGG